MTLSLVIIQFVRSGNVPNLTPLIGIFKPWDSAHDVQIRTSHSCANYFSEHCLDIVIPLLHRLTLQSRKNSITYQTAIHFNISVLLLRLSRCAKRVIVLIAAVWRVIQ